MITILFTILDSIIQFFVFITLGDILFVGLPQPRFHRFARLESCFITGSNRFETQGRVECSAFASAYLYRHFKRDVNGMDLYQEMPCKSRKGYVYCRGIVLLAKKYGFHAKFCIGNLNALKNTLAKGKPVIVMVRSRIGSRDLHYINLVGYDRENFYAVDSADSLHNCNGAHYNRVIPLNEFKKLWNVSMLKQPLYFNLFFDISEKDAKSK